MKQRRVALIVPLLVALALFAIGIRRFLGHSMYFIDDPFISMRFASNLVEHGELVFNLGERVEGYSNFLHVLVHALVFTAAGQPLSAGSAIDSAALFDVLASLMQVVVMLLLARAAQTRAATIGWYCAAVLTLGTWPFAFWAVAGLETPFEGLLYVAIVLAMARLAQAPDGRGALVAMWALLSGLTLLRFEGAAIALPLALLVGLWLGTRGQRKHALALFAGQLAVVGTYHAWRIVYFGSLMPNTYIAKATGGSSVQRLASGASYLSSWLLAELGASTLLIVAALTVTTFGPLRERLSSLLERPVEVLCALVLAGKGFLVVWGGGDWMPGWRMLLPIAPLAFFLVANALSLLIPERATSGRLSIGALVGVMGAAYLLSRVSGATFTGFDGDGDEAGIARKLPRGYMEVGELLERHFAHGRRQVAVGEAGLIPYVARNVSFMDLFGLVDADMARQPGGMHQRVHLAHFLERRPAAVVFAHLHRAPPYGQYQYGQELLASPAFHESYVRAELSDRLDQLGWALYLDRALDTQPSLPRQTDDPLQALLRAPGLTRN